MTIYIDSACKCHMENPDGTMRAFDVSHFDGKCDAFIEGHRYCPEGESYTREDGEVFSGPCIVPWMDFDSLDAAQREYEQQLIADYSAALNTLGVTV